MKNKKSVIFSTLLIVALIVIIPLTVLGSDKEKQVVDENKPNIYLFWGEGCGHCDSLKEFMNSLDSEYTDIYNYNLYEVFNSDSNYEFMLDVSEYFDDKVTGVPYLVIGDVTFNGYSASYNEDIKEAILKLEESKFDVNEKLAERK